MLSTLADGFLACLLNIPLPYNSTEREREREREKLEWWNSDLGLSLA
jgi:hypothetical protein